MHDDACRMVALSQRIGIQLNLHEIRLQVSQVDLRVEAPSGFGPCDLDVAEAKALPAFSHACKPRVDCDSQLSLVCAALAQRSRCGKIQGLNVFAYHAMAAELWGEPRHARSDALQPRLRDPTGVAIVKFRDDLLFQDLIQTRGLHGIVPRFLMLPSVTERPAETRRIGLSPPAIQF